MEVEIYLKVDESKVAAYQKLAEDLGDEISITKPLKFEDLGLSPMENGKFQCLACSKILSRKQTAVDHYKKLHTSSTNQFEYKIQCPRCSQEIAKSALNSHMNQKHGIENFRQGFERSFLPDAMESVQEPAYAFENSVAKRKMPKSTRFIHLYNDPLSSLGKANASENPAKREKIPLTSNAKDMILATMWDQDYYQNNNIKLEQCDNQEASEDLNIKLEQSDKQEASEDLNIKEEQE